jgi:two-component system, LytTR family, sensor kinase
MRKLVFLLLFGSCIVLGQNEKPSIEKINNYRKNDTIKVEMIIDYCVSNTFSNSDAVYKYAKQALDISKNIKYKVGEIRALNCIGNYYYQIASYDKAVKYYNEALSIAEKNKDKHNQVIGLSNLASVYTRIHQENKAISLFKIADSLLLATNNKYSQNRAALLTNMGMAYSSLKQHQKAIEYHLKTLEICENKNIPFGIALSKSNIGEEYIRLKKFTVAKPYLIEAAEISEKSGYDNFLGKIYKNLAEIDLSIANNSSAIQFLEKSIAIAKKVNDQTVLLTTTKLLYETNFVQNDFKNAFLNLKTYAEINEQINGNDKQQIIAEINTKYETEKKEAQIKSLSQQKRIAELESKRQKTTLLLLIVGIISSVIMALLFFKRYKTNQQNQLLKSEIEKAQAESKATESELKALKSQMNPHFIFNALNSIQEQFMFGDKLVANEQMGNFTSLTRQILSVSGKKKIPLSSEIDILSKYLELEKMRFETDFEYNIHFDENIDEEYVELPPMLVQPFVENSIKHGLLHKKGAKKIEIKFQLNDAEDQLICIVEDNGIGRKKAASIKQKNQHNSFSTASVAQRLQMINENDDQNLVYEDLEDENGNPLGTKAVLKIALS